MTQPSGQIQVETTAVIDGMRDVSANVIGQLIHDLAGTRAALLAAQGEVARLTRVNEANRSTGLGNTP